MKKLKRLLTAVLTGALVITSLSVTAFAAEPKVDDTAETIINLETDFAETTEVTFTVSGLTAATTANAFWAAADWSFCPDPQPSVEVPGDGTYSLKAEGCSGKVGVFVVDMKVADAAYDVNDTDYVISDVKVNGENVKFIYGDLEENGNLRLEIYNQYGKTANGMPEIADSSALPYVVDATAGKEVTLDTDFAENTEVTFTVEGLTAETTANAFWAAADWSFSPDPQPSCAVPGDGTYTLSAEGCSGKAGVFVVDMKVADSAYNVHDTNYKISDVKVNGEAVNFIYGDLEENGNLRLEIFNQYGKTAGGFEALLAGPQEEEPFVPVDPVTVFPADVKYGNAPGALPDAVYTVTTDTMYVTLKIAYKQVDDGSGIQGAFNDYCANGICVTNPDGSQRFYAFGGKEVSWDVTVAGAEEPEVMGGANNANGQFFIVGPDGTLEQKILVDGIGTTIGFYALGWDTYDGVQYTVEVIEGGQEAAAATSAPADTQATTAPAEAPAEPSGISPIVWVIIAVAAVAVIACVVVVVVKKKKN